MTDYIEYKIQLKDDAVKDILIARLADAGANGFEEEGSILKAFAAAGTDQSEFEKIIAESGLEYSQSLIPERNWNAEWEAGFTPVTIGHFCTIRADFHAPDTQARYDIIITPKMSFGTGHHATTHLMIEAMEGLNFQGKQVFDFGTGTGILSVIAEKCGAAGITAIDNDAWSIANATDNFNLNECRKILLFNQSGFDENSSYDIILANINRNIILQNLAGIKQHLSSDGVVLLSGLLSGDEAFMVAQARVHKLALRQQSAMNGWICLQLVNG
ncbi:MAG: 50S ribosomal protein L11 methyltransferase [Bacteroidota bacterium]